jgi:PleD family two-component response regulator
LLYFNSLTGGQLTARLQEMDYRVHAISDPGLLQETCEREKPLVLLAEVTMSNGVCAAVAQMKKNPLTAHIPALGFAAAHDKALQTLAEESGVSLLTGNAAVVDHLPVLLDQVLQLD